MAARITVDKEEIAEFCRMNGIRKLSFFGSVLREDFRPDSDVDVLVEFEPGVRIGLFGMSGLQEELADLMGRPVDLRTAEDLSRYFRDEGVDRAELQYAA